MSTLQKVVWSSIFILVLGIAGINCYQHSRITGDDIFISLVKEKEGNQESFNQFLKVWNPKSDMEPSFRGLFLTISYKYPNVSEKEISIATEKTFLWLLAKKEGIK